MIWIGLVIGLTVYFGLKLRVYEGTIKEFFTKKETALPAYISVICALAMIIGVDWDRISISIQVAGIPVYYHYVISLAVGMGNSTLFFSLYKKKKVKKNE